MGAGVDAGLHSPSAQGPQCGLRHLDEPGGFQPNPAAALLICTPRVRATIIGGREDTLRDPREMLH
jgi:hypothetical protein